MSGGTVAFLVVALVLAGLGIAVADMAEPYVAGLNMATWPERWAPLP